jgi:hypothetical protein
LATAPRTIHKKARGTRSSEGGEENAEQDNAIAQSGGIGAYRLLGCAKAEVIGFDGIGDNGEPFTFYTEDGFMVFPAGGEPWINNTVYGRPAPSVIFNRHRGDPERWAGMFICAEDVSDFTFSAVDLYSSVTPIPYRFIGYNEGMPLFDFSATLPNTFGQFVTAFNAASDVLIDLLYIELVNPFNPIGDNPVGFDNVVVNLASAVPEPGTVSLAALHWPLLRRHDVALGGGWTAARAWRKGGIHI